MDLIVAGQPVYAATGGRPFDATKPAVVFLHGAGMDHTVWALQTRWFAYHGFAVLAVDLPGHGRSGGAPLASIDALADWTAVLIAAAGLEAAALVGHSMGALVALDCAGRHGGLVSRLALCGVAPRMPVHPDLLAAAAANDPKAFALICDWGHGPAGHLGGHRAPGLWMLGGADRLLATSRPGALSVDLVNCDSYQAAPERAAAVACPTLLLLGERDKMTPARAGRKLAAAIAGATVVELAGAGHMMMLEQPDQTLDALKDAFTA